MDIESGNRIRRRCETRTRRDRWTGNFVSAVPGRSRPAEFVLRVRQAPTCERCFRTERRGKPFGIDFFYKGGERWKPADKKKAKGCVACGWYDIAAGRKALNARHREK